MIFNKKCTLISRKWLIWIISARLYFKMVLQLLIAFANICLISATTEVSVPVSVFYTASTPNKDYILSNLVASVNAKTTDLKSGISFSLEFI